ncbi:MAG: hypothetical protein KA243_01550 [Candidatus Aminicenantes bacterium]|nr:hypothetical protein [Candidatus Aminicenantes bacterium]
MKIRKILIRIGIGFLAFVAAVLAVRAVLNFTEGRALARTLAELKSRGIPLTGKDLAPPCADEDNGARLWKAYENMSVIPGRHIFKPGGPAHKDREMDVRGLISRSWRDHTNGQPITPSDRAALKEVILKNEKAFALLADIGGKPCFLYRDPSDPVFLSLMPDAIQAIGTERLLFFSILFSAEEGDWKGAIDRLGVGLRLAPVMSLEGTQMAFLISLACANLLTQPLADICRGREIAAEDLTRLMAVLEPGPRRDRLALAWRGERIAFVEVGAYLLEGDLGDLGSVWEGRHWWHKIAIWLARPLVKRDLRRSLPSYEFLEAQAKLPYYQCRDALRARDEELQSKPWYAIASKMMIGSAEAAFMKTAKTEAITLASRTGLACRLYKSRTGHYPQTLDELVPGLLSEVPIDPFTGKPLVYRREGEGFIVYSLGSNEKDDGGRSTYNITQMVMPKDDDWCWREDR